MADPGLELKAQYVPKITGPGILKEIRHHRPQEESNSRTMRNFFDREVM